MELKGSQTIEASGSKVWEALNDIRVLKSCIPGCDSIEQNSPNDFNAVMAAKVGPISARFKCKLKIVESSPPDSYKMIFEGQGGVAGMVKGDVAVTLSKSGSATKLDYSGQAQISGKLAQIGARLVDLAAKKTVADFFVSFNKIVANEAVPKTSDLGEPVADASVAPTIISRISTKLPWLIAAAALLLAAIAWLRR
jgi:uncharacterized protein